MVDAKEDTSFIEFAAPKRYSGSSKYNYLKLFNLAIDSIIAFSIKPLRIGLIVSSLTFLFSIFYGIFILIYWLLGYIEVPGLTTQIMLTILLGSANLLLLSIVGEYIGRIHIETKNRPLYTIKKLVNFDA